MKTNEEEESIQTAEQDIVVADNEAGSVAEVEESKTPQPIGPTELQENATWNGSGDVVLQLDTSSPEDVVVYQVTTTIKPGDIIADELMYWNPPTVDLKGGTVTFTESQIQSAIQEMEKQIGGEYKFTRGTIELMLILVDRSNLDENGNVIDWDLIYKGILYSDIALNLNQVEIEFPTLQEGVLWNGSGDAVLSFDVGGLTDPVVDQYTASIWRDGDMERFGFDVDESDFDFSTGKVTLTEADIYDAIDIWKTENNNETQFLVGVIYLNATVTEKSNLDGAGNIIDRSKVYSLHSQIGINLIPAPEVVSEVWNGEQDIEIMIPDGLTDVEVVDILGLKDGVAPFDYLNDIKQEIVGNKIILNGETLKNSTFGREELPMVWEEVDELEILIKFTYEGITRDKRLYVSVDLNGSEPEEPVIDWEKGEYYEDGLTYYLLDMKFGNGVSGYDSIEAGENVRQAVKDGKTYYFVLPNSAPLDLMFDIDEKYIDRSNGASLKDGYEMQVKLVSGDGKSEPVGNGAPDWVIKFTAAKASTFEVSVVEEGASEPEETKQIVDKTSGVSMNLPTDAPEGLSLKVSESNGAEEKEAVSELVQVDGDKIKTFDLSLLLDGKAWEYDGQFKSKVTLPVPEGWNLNLLGLYYFDEAANKATAVPFTVDKENGTITFETDHFSRYVLVQKVAAQTDADGADDKTTPKTGDAANVTLYMMMLLVAGAAVVAFERKRRA